MVGEPWIQFYGDDARSDSREFVGESTQAGADLQDEIVRVDAGLFNQFASEAFAANEMLTARPRLPLRRAPSLRAHGPSP